MSKKVFNGAIVVEGKMDLDLLSSFLDCEIITTNGSEISKGTIEYIREVKKRKRVIVLTDPDAPGKRIRDILNESIEGLDNAYLPKEKCIKKKKVGVAECDKETILEALEHLIPGDTKNVTSDLAQADLLELGLMGSNDSSQRRKKLEDELHLGHTNGKTLLKRLRSLGINKEDLKGFYE